MSKKQQRIFNGFEQANTTPVPDVLFDELLADLSGAELKVLMYIIRRTKGFKKDADAISLSQFENGIVKTDGTVLDRGCGLGRETICKALLSLEKRQCIKSEKHFDEYGAKGITVYSIRFKGEVVGKSDQGGSRKIVPPNVVGKTDQGSRIRRRKVVGKSDLQETVLQQTEGTYGNGNSATADNSHSSTHSSLSVSLENASLQDLYARLNQLEQESPELEQLFTPDVDKQASSVDNSPEPQLPIATVTTGNASIERHTEKLDPLGIYDEQEKQQHQWWCELGLAVKVNVTNKGHWATLSQHVQSFEDMKSLYDYTEQQIENDPSFQDKTVKPGNLANADNLNGWKKKKRRAEKPKDSSKPSSVSGMRNYTFEPEPQPTIQEPPPGELVAVPGFSLKAMREKLRKERANV